MRAKRVAGLLLAVLFFAGGAAAADSAGGRLAAGVPAAVLTAQSTAPGAPAAPAQRSDSLDYLPRGEERGGGELGWALIAAAVVLAIVIVIFVVRHRRTGRPG